MNHKALDFWLQHKKKTLNLHKKFCPKSKTHSGGFGVGFWPVGNILGGLCFRCFAFPVVKLKEMVVVTES